MDECRTLIFPSLLRNPNFPRLCSIGQDNPDSIRSRFGPAQISPKPVFIFQNPRLRLRNRRNSPGCRNCNRHPVLSAFLSPTFPTSTFSSSALSSGSLASTAEKLHSSILLLDSHLRSLFLSRHEDLLSHLSTLHSLPLPSLRHSLSSLSSSLQHLRASLSSSLLCHHESSPVLLDVDEAVDLAKSAQLYREFFGICEEYDLAGIDVLDEEIQFVGGVGDRIRKEGMRILEKGMEGLNQAEVGTGLQVFYNLGELRSTVEAAVGRYMSMGAKSVSVAFDMKAIGGGSGYGPGDVEEG